MIRLLIVTIIVILLAYNPTAFWEDSITKARTSTASIRRSSYINSFTLDKDRIYIRLTLGNDLTNSNTI